MICSPAQIDRYPAKMVGQLADALVKKYAEKCDHLFDPFCGSGAILTSGKKRGLVVSGCDINPYAVLLTEVKLNGFDPNKAQQLLTRVISSARSSEMTLPTTWPLDYWFTRGTLDKYLRIRFSAKKHKLSETKEGRAVLLSIASSVRRCSRADQRSPKPFISKEAILFRKGKHFDPYDIISVTFSKLKELYRTIATDESEVRAIDIVKNVSSVDFQSNSYSRVITSPPYINAQDYFRNFKLELYLLEGLLPFAVSDVKSRFVGTEQGQLLEDVTREEEDWFRKLVPSLARIAEAGNKAEPIIYRYLHDMNAVFDRLIKIAKPGGTLVLVCGDNLISGFRIPTWQILSSILEKKGFEMFDRFHDAIERRSLAPVRSGHKGLIKEEVISAYLFPTK